MPSRIGRHCVIGAPGALKATPLRVRPQPSLDRPRPTAPTGQYEERPRLGVAGCFLDEMYAGSQPRFGVDVREVGLDGAR